MPLFLKTENKNELSKSSRFFFLGVGGEVLLSCFLPLLVLLILFHVRGSKYKSQEMKASSLVSCWCIPALRWKEWLHGLCESSAEGPISLSSLIMLGHFAEPKPLHQSISAATQEAWGMFQSCRLLVC